MPLADDRPIHPQSKEFMAWAKEYMRDDARVLSLINEALFRAKNSLRGREFLKFDLGAKLTKGAREHGSPIYTKHQLKKEFDDESIDLIGWLLIEKWNTLQNHG